MCRGQQPYRGTPRLTEVPKQPSPCSYPGYPARHKVTQQNHLQLVPASHPRTGNPRLLGACYICRSPVLGGKGRPELNSGPITDSGKSAQCWVSSLHNQIS